MCLGRSICFSRNSVPSPKRAMTKWPAAAPDAISGASISTSSRIRNWIRPPATPFLKSIPSSPSGFDASPIRIVLYATSTSVNPNLLTIDSAIEVIRHEDAPRELRDAPTKTANARRLTLDPTTHAAIWELRREREPYGPWMFGVGEQMCAPDRIGWWWTRARKLSDIDRKLVELVAARQEIVGEIGRNKQTSGAATRSRARSM